MPLAARGGAPEMRKYTVWVKDGMEWMRSVIRDPTLVTEFTWHAYKKELVINGEVDQIYDDPLSGSAAWENEVCLTVFLPLPSNTHRLLQSKLTGDQVQLPLMIYSDKSNAARFSKTMDIYPALMRIANLPSHIRNRNSHHGGNTMIGLLPKVDATSQDKRNPCWANHVREVHHRAWHYILEPIIAVSESGFTMKCGDGIIRTIMPYVAIISNDLEEAYVLISLISGSKFWPDPLAISLHSLEVINLYSLALVVLFQGNACQTYMAAGIFVLEMPR